MKRAAIYARVSTNNGQNPEMQLGELRSYCSRRGWEVGQEYVDVGVSGAKEDRPALDRLLSDCRKRLVDAVVVQGRHSSRLIHFFLANLHSNMYDYGSGKQEPARGSPGQAGRKGPCPKDDAETETGLGAARRTDTFP